MILLERADVDRIGLDPYWFLIQWVPGSHAAMKVDYADTPSPGPFLLRVHDEAAWVSHNGVDDWRKVAMRYRYDCEPQRQWGSLVELYAADVGVSQMSFLGRWASIRRQLKKTPQTWQDWRTVYHWPEEPDLVWSGVLYHPLLETREHHGRKEVRYVSRQA